MDSRVLIRCRVREEIGERYDYDGADALELIAQTTSQGVWGVPRWPNTHTEDGWCYYVTPRGSFWDRLPGEPPPPLILEALERQGIDWRQLDQRPMPLDWQAIWERQRAPIAAR